MVSLEFLTEIGFAQEMIEQYIAYANILDNKIIPICDAWLLDDCNMISMHIQEKLFQLENL